MTEQETLERVTRLCNGDVEGVDFICRWAKLAHRVDDFADGDAVGNENFLGVIAELFMLTSHPFYLRHLPALRAVALTVLNMYADSVAWEKSDVRYQREFANCYRHAGNEMLIAVGQLCGGFDAARQFSLAQREVCYATQHPEEKAA